MRKRARRMSPGLGASGFVREKRRCREPVGSRMASSEVVWVFRGSGQWERWEGGGG